MQATPQIGRQTSAIFPHPFMHVVKHFSYAAPPASTVGILERMTSAISVKGSGLEERADGPEKIPHVFDVTEDNADIFSPCLLRSSFSNFLTLPYIPTFDKGKLRSHAR